MVMVARKERVGERVPTGGRPFYEREAGPPHLSLDTREARPNLETGLISMTYAKL